ncbi:uncharacterized protein LOC131950243 [Physella acuta]|uniref:uncharacterized protein LOC131950243 n=1 Tax=Physella acuta TaxID=109671 RepID=UPI0027DE42AF|nr:uncharacterized protein LOC131950243 [Physella acuta]
MYFSTKYCVRLTPLETLQSVFNTKLKTRDENLDQINKLTRKIVDLETEHRRRSGAIAFSAELKGYKYFKTGRAIKKYSCVFCDEGNNFNPETGEFTAPVDGVYLVSATVVELNGMYVNIGVYVKATGFHGGDETVIGVTQTNTAKNSACSVNVADIKAGEKVFLKIDDMDKGAELSSSTIFTCIKL